MAEEKKMINIEVGERLKAARENRKCTQNEFAAALNVEVGQYYKLENGTHGLNAEKLMILHRDYQIDPTFLITGEDPRIANVKLYLESCNEEDREKFMDRMVEFLKKSIKISLFPD